MLPEANSIHWLLVTFSGAFALLAAFFVLSPFFSKSEGPVLDPASEKYQSLYDQRDRCLQVLKDLELDFSTQKLTETDYQEMKRSVSLELSKILKQIG